jgi:hypothetical protein
MKFLGFLFLSILVSTGIVIGAQYVPSEFLGNFLEKDFISVFASLVGLNIAAVIFLLGQISVIEEKINTNQMSTAKKEIKHNACFIIISFVTSLILLFFRPDMLLCSSSVCSRFLNVINILLLSLFFLAIYSIYEIVNASFVLSKFSIKK